MKRILVTLLAVTFLLVAPFGVFAYTIDDDPADGIGGYGVTPNLGFESYGINVYNFTPGVNSGGIVFELFTDYTGDVSVTSGNYTWDTKYADLFIYEHVYKDWDDQYGHFPKGTNTYAIPLVDHGNFLKDHLYIVDSVFTSDDIFDDQVGGGSFLWNHDVPVWIASGTDTGWTGSSTLGGDLPISITLNSKIWENVGTAYFELLWGTATCANDVVTGTVGAPVPEPATMLLLGIGLVGLAGIGRKKFMK